MNTRSEIWHALGKTWSYQLHQIGRALEKKIKIGFGLAAAFLAIIGIVSYEMTLELTETDYWETKSNSALAKLAAVSSSLKDAEVAQRGYLITGNELYLEPYVAAKVMIGENLQDLRTLNGSTPSQLQRIEALQPLIIENFHQIESSVALRKEGGAELAIEPILRQEGSAIVEEIQQVIRDLENEEKFLLQQRSEQAEITAQNMVLSISVGSFAAVALMTLATFVISKDVGARERVEESLRKSRDQLAIILHGVADGIIVQDNTDRLIYANDAAARAFGYPAAQALLDVPTTQVFQKLEIVDESDRPLTYGQLPVWRALRGEQNPQANLRFRIPATGEDRWMVHRATPVFDERGRVQFAINIFHDVTERVLAYQTLERRVEERTHEIERRRHVAEGLRDILTVLNSDRPLEEILDAIVAQASQQLGTDAGAVYRLDEDDESLAIHAARGLEAADAALALPLGWGPMGLVVMTHQPVAVSNTMGVLPGKPDAEFDPVLQAGLNRLHQRYRALLAVPLVVKDAFYGAIALYYTAPREFTKEEIEMAVAFSDQAALAIENARLRVQAERMAVAAERSRLARELHDAVTQTLFSSSLIADVLPRLWERNPKEAQRRLEELRQLTRSALAEMRMLLLELRPATLVEIPLGELLRQLIEAISNRAHVQVALDVEGHCTLLPDVQIALYRIAQEALNNVSRHAGAGQVSVRLRCQSERVELEISDDGQGFDPANVGREHLGLDIMRERAATIDANLAIDSEPGRGTRIAVVWAQLSHEVGGSTRAD